MAIKKIITNVTLKRNFKIISSTIICSKTNYNIENYINALKPKMQKKLIPDILPTQR